MNPDNFNHCDAGCFFSRMIDIGAVLYDSATCRDSVGKIFLRTRFAVDVSEYNGKVVGYIDNYPSGDTHHYITQL